jgi:hypothetical protein
VSRAAQISETGVAVLPNCFRVNLFLAQIIRRRQPLLPCRFDVYGHARTRSVIPKWLNSFAFQPVSNLPSGIGLAFDGRIKLAFGCNVSIG